MNALITVKMKIENVCNEEDLKGVSFEDIVNNLIKEEGLFGVIDGESIKVLKIEKE